MAIVGVYEGVEAYPACGNERITHAGVTWYPVARGTGQPVDQAFQAHVDEIFASDRESPADFRRSGFVSVAPPGPGDDVGTLVVWADGVARWTSVSGELDVWLMDDELSYHWEC